MLLIPNVLHITMPDPSVTPSAAVVASSFPPSVVNGPLNRMFKGAISSTGTWQQEAAAGWRIERPSVGLYKIWHYQQQLNYSVSANMTNGNIIEMTDQWFTVQITDNQGQPKDADFAFSMSFG